MELRKLINYLDDREELVRIRKPVDPRYEMAAILLEMEKRQDQTVLFENVTGREAMAVGNLYNSPKRILYSLGTGKELTSGEARRALKDTLRRSFGQKLKEKEFVTKEAPSQELVWRDEKAMGALLPAPLYIEDENEPYITAAVLFVGTGDGGIATQVVQVQAKKDGKMALSAGSPPLSVLFEEAARHQQALEAVLAIGVPGELMLAAVAPPALAGTDKITLAAVLRGEPLPVFRGKTVSIPLPAEAEYIIEGLVRPWMKMEIGPYSSYYKTWFKSGNACEMEVTAFAHRKDPFYENILPDSQETLTLVAIPTEIALEKLISDFVPGGADVYLRSGSCAHNAVVAVGADGAAKAREIIELLLKEKFLLKKVILVDRDIDPEDPFAVEWALAARVQADRDVVVLSNQTGSPLDPSAAAGGITAKLGIDATAAATGERFARAGLPAEILEKVRQQWDGYFV